MINNTDKYIVFTNEEVDEAKSFCKSNIIGTLMFQLCKYKMLSKQEYFDFHPKPSEKKIVVIGTYLSYQVSEGQHSSLFLPRYLADLA